VKRPTDPGLFHYALKRLSAALSHTPRAHSNTKKSLAELCPVRLRPDTSLLPRKYAVGAGNAFVADVCQCKYGPYCGLCLTAVRLLGAGFAGNAQFGRTGNRGTLPIMFLLFGNVLRRTLKSDLYAAA